MSHFLDITFRPHLLDLELLLCRRGLGSLLFLLLERFFLRVFRLGNWRCRLFAFIGWEDLMGWLGFGFGFGEEDEDEAGVLFLPRVRRMVLGIFLVGIEVCVRIGRFWLVLLIN